MTNQQWPSWRSVWEISATLTLKPRPHRKQTTTWEVGWRGVPDTGGVLTRTTECHSPVPIGSLRSQTFSWSLPVKKKREWKKHWANYSRGRVMMVCMQWEGWRRKVGCREQYQGKSKVFPPVPKVQGNSRAYFFMYMHFIHWELYTHFDSESHW